MGAASTTGLGGNSSPVLLDNFGVLDSVQKEMAKEATEKYFSFWGGCDFSLQQEEIILGVEPAYFGDDLLIISVNRERGNSFIQTGHAFGYWGAGIRSKKKYYKEYKKNGKFKKFVDKWHPLLFSSKK